VYHLLAAARYVEMNPVAVGLVENPGDYRWSSARAHLDGKDDALGTGAPLLEMVGDWNSFLFTATRHSVPGAAQQGLHHKPINSKPRFD
jgi:REP-associated tyrosine transposase